MSAKHEPLVAPSARVARILVDASEDADLGDVLELETIIIERRTLIRDCLISSLLVAGLKGHIRGYPSLAAYLDMNRATQTTAILIASDSLDGSTSFTASRAETMRAADAGPFFLMLADDIDPAKVRFALSNHFRAYVPMSLPLGVLVEIINLVRAGGIFAPPNYSAGSQTSGRRSTDVSERVEAALTSRQNAVIDALRQGKSNKAIAYALDMRESTVKVHIRNVMRKLKAHSRTEIVFLMNRMDSASRQSAGVVF